jgi:hypothetical protein
MRQARHGAANPVWRSQGATRLQLGFLLLGVCLMTIGIGTARASAPIGVGIQALPIKLAIPAKPGSVNHFPSVYVINNGEQAFIASFTAEPLNKGAQHVAPGSWISFPHETVSLKPGASAHIPVTLRVPGGAVTGTYLTDVVVHAKAAGSSSGVGTQIAAAAAAKLEFTVSTVVTPVKGTPKWVLPAGIALGFVVLLLFLWRIGVRISLKRPE